MKAFPRFSWYRICDRAKENGMYRNRTVTNTGPWQTNPYHRTMSYRDLEAAASLAQEPEWKERLQEIANDLATRTQRGGLSGHWLLPLDEVSYLSILDNMNDLLNVSGLPYGSHRPA